MIIISTLEGIPPPVDGKSLKKILKQFLQHLGHSKRHLSVYLTDDYEIQALNLIHRKKDAPTDVLSWSYWEEDPNSDTLGDLAISIDRITAQAQEHGFSVSDELLRILAHGCAHLAGYDHERSKAEERKMLSVEIELLSLIGLAHLYPDG